MEITLKSLFSFGAVLLTGLSAGLFYAWSVSVIPGTQKVNDITYLQSMQSINRAILNPAFFIVFFGSALALVATVLYDFNTSELSTWLSSSAALCYLVGMIGVTGMGNVPLNNQLDVLELSQLSEAKMAEFRQFYESNWNRLHSIRTIAGVVAFILALLAIFVDAK